MPLLEPFSLGHHLGMLQAILLEVWSLEPGRKQDTVSWGTTQNLRSPLTVLWEAPPESGSDITISTGS